MGWVLGWVVLLINGVVILSRFKMLQSHGAHSSVSFARVVNQPPDNSCLFQSNSFCMQYQNISSALYAMNSGASLRSSIVNFLLDNGSQIVTLSPEIAVSVSDSMYADGHTISSYAIIMSNPSEWGSASGVSKISFVIHWR